MDSTQARIRLIHFDAAGAAAKVAALEAAGYEVDAQPRDRFLRIVGETVSRIDEPGGE